MPLVRFWARRKSLSSTLKQRSSGVSPLLYSLEPMPKEPSVVRDYKKSDYIVGKMNINSSILSPIKPDQPTKRFFSKRVKRINRKKAKKWLKKFNYAESTKSIRKALSRFARKRGSMPYCMSQVGSVLSQKSFFSAILTFQLQKPSSGREKMMTMRKPVNTPLMNLRAGIYLHSSFRNQHFQET